MKSKINKVKWTKKFKALVISLSLVFAVALGGACAAIGLTVENNKRFGTPVAGGVADENTPQLPEAAETFYAGATIGDVTYTTNAEAWAAAINYSIENSVAVQFDLKTSWTADVSSGFGAATETNSPFGAAGSLNVPEGANVILNISKNVKLDRNLADAAGAETSKAIENGNVITSSGTLYLTGNGTITGGNTTGFGGGVNGVKGTVAIYGSTISGNTASTGGGIYSAGKFIMSAGNVTGNSSTVSSETVSGGGGILIASGSQHAVITGGTISKNTAASRGGGIYLGLNAEETTGDGTSKKLEHELSNVTISENTGFLGGGVFFASTSVSKIGENTSIINNTSNADGGGVFAASNSTVTMSGGEISGNKTQSDNTSVGGGGVILFSGATFTMDGGVIKNNTAVIGGGVMLYENQPKFIMNSGEISGNTATGSGGGIYANAGSIVTINGGTISGNKATGWGGGIFANAVPALNINNCTITENTVDGVGAGIGINGNSESNIAKANIHNSVLSNNKATGEGGAIMTNIWVDLIIGTKDDPNDITEVSGNTGTYGAGVRCTGIEAYYTKFINNKCVKIGNGGGLRVVGYRDEAANQTTVIDHCTFTGNSADYSGGGMSIETYPLNYPNPTVIPYLNCIINDSLISNNSAVGNGGGVQIAIGHDIGNIITQSNRNEISNNTANVNGGGVFVACAGTFTMNGGTISDNTAVAVAGDSSAGGGGIYLASGNTLNLTNVDLTNNNTTGIGGCIYMGKSETASDKTVANIENCRINGNKAYACGAIYMRYGSNGEAAGNSSLTITASGNGVMELCDNEATGRIGGIYCNTNCSLVINGTATNKVRFENNRALNGDGGALSCDNSVAELNYVDILNNTAGTTGGGIYNTSTATLNNVTISGNTAVDGGAIYNSGTLSLCGKTTITGNEALNNGGGIYQNGTLWFRDANKKTVTGNMSTQMTNNVYIGADKHIALDNISPNGVNAGISLAKPQNFISDCTVKLTFTNDGSETGYFPDIPTNYSITETLTDGKYYYAINSKLTGTLAQRWKTAVTQSISTGKQQLFELTADWNLNTDTEVPSGAYNASTNPAFSVKRLYVPANADVVLDLKNFTLTRGLTEQTEDGSVIYVDGKLTIKGSGTITGGHATNKFGGVLVNGELILNGGKISGNKLLQNGTPGVYVDVGGTFTMNGGSIYNNITTGGGNAGGVFIAHGGTFTMNGGNIQSNQGGAGGIGGVSSYGTFVMNGGTISENNAQNNSGVQIYEGTFEMNGGAISDNPGYYQGGVHVAKDTTFTMTGGTISGNSASYTDEHATITRCNGVTVAGTFNMSGGKISKNTNNVSRGGLWVTSSGVANISGGEISGNTATKGAGAYVEGTLNMTGGTISGNTASAYGGNVYAEANSTFTMSGGTISGGILTSTEKVDGVALARGCGIYATKATVEISGGYIKDNVTGSVRGGGIFASECDLTISGGTISGNATTGFAGGVYVWECKSFTLSGDAVITGNTAASNGGGLAISCESADTILYLTGGRIENNTAGLGGGVYFTGKGKLNVSGTRIIGNSASYNGGGFAVNVLVSLTIGDNTEISNNTATQNGGGIYSFTESTVEGPAVTVSGNAKINQNTAVKGGGICINTGTLNMTGGEISDNSAVTNGGGVYVNAGTFNMFGGIISGNSAENGGGVFVNTGATFNMSGGTISGNTAVRGGGVYVAPDSSFIMDGGTVTFNEAIVVNNDGGHGGGIYNYGTSTVSANAVISNNTAGTNGGGICNVKTFTMSGGIISDNTAESGGGGIFNNSTLSLTGGTITGNVAVNSGGICNYTNSTFTMSDTAVISGNSASNGGGVGVYGTATMTGGSIFGNTASDNGGGVFINTGATFTMEGGTIGGDTPEEGNKSDVNGGGVYVGGTFELSGGTISENTAAGNGGGVYNSGTFTMTDGSVSSNTAYWGGGMFIADKSTSSISDKAEISENTATENGGAMYIRPNVTSLEITGGTILKNTAAYRGGAIYQISSTFKLQDCTISDNTAIYGGGVYVSDVVNVSGNVNISENTDTDGNASNVYLRDGKKITVAGALGANAKIGVTMATAGEFTTGFAAANSGKHPHSVFFADDNKLTVGWNAAQTEATLLECVNINVTVCDKANKPTETTAIVKVDANTAAAFNPSADKTQFVFKTTQGGLANQTTNIAIPVIAGYTPYVYSEATGAEIATGTTVVEDVNWQIRYKANDDTAYKVYYILQNANPNGTAYDDDGYLTETDPVKLAQDSYKNYVKIYNGTGTSDGALVYLGEGNVALADWAEKQYYTFDRIDVENPTVKGDGTSVVLVYMKLNEYTVTVDAQGGSFATRSLTIKHGGVIPAFTKEPTKSLNTFKWWSYIPGDKAGAQKVNFGVDTVTENKTIYAYYTTQEFTVTFNLNVDGEQFGLDTANSLQSAGANFAGSYVTWDAKSLFPESSFGDNYVDGELVENNGAVTIVYTVNNVKSPKTLINFTPSAFGYEFKGWYVNFESGTSATTSLKKPTATTKPITLTAKWEPAYVNVRFDFDNGEAILTKRVKNLCDWSELLPDMATHTKSGYTFDDWYPTPDKSLAPVTDYGDVFSIAAFEEIIATDEFVYDLSNFTFYAIWESVQVELKVPERIDHGSIELKKNGTTITPGVTVQIGDVITVAATPATGYEFNCLKINDKELGKGVTTFTVSGADVKSVGEGENRQNYIDVTAVFTEMSYRITYLNNGGTKAPDNLPRRYSPSNVSDDGSNDPVMMPTDIYKVGYDFKGWFIEGTETAAFRLVEENNGDLRNAEMYLSVAQANFGDLRLTAKWEEQPATVYIYNATYPNDNNYQYNSELSAFYTVEDENGVKLVTGSKVEINNPWRDAFEFLGWSTKRGGTVAYPVEEGKDTITYTVNADYDQNGNELNRNNLWAVWHVRGVNHIIMAATNNDTVYGGDGITMTAAPAQNYNVGDLEGVEIRLSYSWYKVVEGRYNDCFTVVDYEKDGYFWIVDGDGSLLAFESTKDGKFYAPSTTENGKPSDTVIEKPANGVRLTYKEFNKDSASGDENAACVYRFGKDNLTPEQTYEVTIRNVADCGTYICVVEVSAKDDQSVTRAGGYGEIEITMSKAHYEGVTFAGKEVVYNGKAQAGAVKIESAELDSTDGILHLNDVKFKYTDGEKTPIAGSGSRVSVTYRYYVGEGENRKEIFDLDTVKNAGTYHVVATFAFVTEDEVSYDNGNYILPDPIEVDLVIKPYEISNIGYTFMHGDEVLGTSGEFKGGYDGKAYGVEVSINDKFTLGGSVTENDEVSLVTKVKKFDGELGEIDVDGATVAAGDYILYIVGLDGADKGNFKLSGAITLNKAYTIGKAKYDIDGKIKFENAEVEFDGSEHTISCTLEDGYEWPESLKVTYKVIDYAAELAGYSESDNIATTQNGGKYAGVYTVTASFSDKTLGANFEALGDMTATLTITKANLLEFYANGYGVDGGAGASEADKEAAKAELLKEGGFVSASYAWKSLDQFANGDLGYYPCVGGTGRLANPNNFKLTYSYYSVDEKTEVRNPLFDGNMTVSEIKAAEAGRDYGFIFNAGKYEIIAHIEYLSNFYINNFEEVTDSEATITYVIREVDVESVTVTEWAEGVTDSEGKIVKKLSLGDAFDYALIKKITVKFAGTAGSRDVTGDDIKLAAIKYEQDGATVKSTLWHVGDFKIKVAVYGTDSVEYTFKVVEKVTRYELQYSADGIVYEPVPEEGLPQLALGETYSFKVVFSAATTNSEIKTPMDLIATYENLVLGENVLTLANSDSAESANYDLGGVKVNIYKVITDKDIVWKYGVEGGELKIIDIETPEIPYIGKEYKIFATFTDDGKEQSVEAESIRKLPVLYAGSYGIKITAGGKYKVELENDFSVVVTPMVLEITWSSEKLAYNTRHQTHTVSESNVLAADKEGVTFTYSYTDAEGNTLDTPSDEVVNVGEYTVTVSLEGDLAENYTLDGCENISHVFNIVKADLNMTAVYNEHTYGVNVTYAGNIQGLRLDAVKADFGTNSAVAGKFAFITGLQEDGSYTEVAGDSTVVKAALATAQSGATVQYAYVPTNDIDKKNYNIKIDVLTLNVLKQAARSGADSLSVEFGKGAKTFYLVNEKLDKKGIEVNRLYQSAYKENGKWYGYIAKVANADFRVDNEPIENYTISAQDVSRGSIALKAIYGNSWGTLDVPVLNDTPKAVSIISTDHRTRFYVGEPYSFEDVKVEVEFEKTATKRIFDYASGVISLKENVSLDEAGEKVITFLVFEKECSLTVTVEEPKDVTFKAPANKVLTHTGEVLDYPKITFVVGGNEYTELDGITVKNVVVYKANTSETADFKDDGMYDLEYTFECENYEYRLTSVTYMLRGVQITSNPYKVTITEPAGEKQVTYDGKAHEIPQPTISEVTDTLHGNEVVDSGNVTVKYQIYKKGTTPPPATENPNWTVTDRGEYIVKIEVYVKGYAQCVGSLEYGYVIEQAENEITGFEVPAFVVEGDDYDFEVEATFGKNKAELRYDKSENGTFTKTAPDSTGIWFVKVTIPEDNNYKEVSQVKSFEVRAAEVADGENSVSGGDGVGSGWTLEVSEDDVSEVSISQQEVLGGYEVLLKDGNGNVQKNASKEYTVRIKLSEELAGKGNLKVFYYDENGNASARNATVEEDGYLVIKTKDFGRFVITNEIAVEKEPVGLLVAVIILGVVAAGGIAACVAVFLKKRKKGGAR